ncbi:MAG: cytochrome c class [Bryobacterales bacterium]|nr:cytochrome c class [Bryobacterales bacterium]
MLVAASLTPLMGGTQTADPGQQIFSSTCAACHGLDGRGGEHAPNIATDPTVQRMTDRELTGIVRYGIQGKGMPGFASSLQQNGIRAVVKYLRILGGQGTGGPLPGDASRGKALYFGPARCGECHTIQGEGGFLGADLSGYGRTHSPAATREAILDPNKNTDPRHGTVTAVTRTGKTFTGVVRNEDNFTLQMQTPDGCFHLLEKRDLARLEHQSKSLMPSNYGTKLSTAQVDDLVKFLSVTPGPQTSEPDREE